MVEYGCATQGDVGATEGEKVQFERLKKIAQGVRKAGRVKSSLTMTWTCVAEHKPDLQGVQAVQPWKFCK